MRKYLLASAAAVVLSTGAIAADLPVRGPAVAPAPVFVAMNWSGFYVGAQAGWIQGRDRITVLVPAAAGTATISSSSVIGGLYAGYNWQFNSMVIGLEADANVSGVKKSVNVFSGGVIAPNSVTGRSNFEAGLVAKVGVAFDNALIYVLGGVSIADFSTRYNSLAPVAPAVSFDDTRLGWTLGAGLAYKFNPNWSARIEYRYSDFGSKTHSITAPGNFFNGDVIRHRYSSQRVMAGLTYHFGGPAAPVVAKY